MDSESGISQEEAMEKLVATIPKGRPEELGALVAFLASMRASFITGTSTLVDGGQHPGLFSTVTYGGDRVPH